MKLTLPLLNSLFAICLGFTGPTQLSASPDTSQALSALGTQIDSSLYSGTALRAIPKSELLAFCTDSVFVAAVKEQNSRKLTLSEIKAIDAKWIASDVDLPIQKSLLNNAVADEIRNIGKRLPSMSEVIVMDNQGANVGQNMMTSDYWQGDEPKFKNAFNGGKGGVDIEKARLDKSSRRVDQKISLPIIDTDGTVIGAVCIGLLI